MVRRVPKNKNEEKATTAPKSKVIKKEPAQKVARVTRASGRAAASKQSEASQTKAVQVKSPPPASQAPQKKRAASKKVEPQAPKAPLAPKVAKSTKATKATKAPKATKASEVAKPAKPAKAPKAAKIQPPKPVLEVLFSMDLTNSMTKHIDNAKKNVAKIITQIVSLYKKKYQIRIGFVGYTDYDDTPRFTISRFREDIPALKKWIDDNVNASERAELDWAEDVAGGLNRCLNNDWTEGSARQVILIADAPAHGYCSSSKNWERFPEGDPDGLKIEDLVADLYASKIQLALVPLHWSTEAMKIMFEKYHPFFSVIQFDKVPKARATQELIDAAIDWKDPKLQQNGE